MRTICDPATAAVRTADEQRHDGSKTCRGQESTGGAYAARAPVKFQFAAPLLSNPDCIRVCLALARRWQGCSQRQHSTPSTNFPFQIAHSTAPWRQKINDFRFISCWCSVFTASAILFLPQAPSPRAPQSRITSYSITAPRESDVSSATMMRRSCSCSCTLEVPADTLDA